ncbi:unnamed protein product [Chrysoparadoxa australica]
MTCVVTTEQKVFCWGVDNQTGHQGINYGQVNHPPPSEAPFYDFSFVGPDPKIAKFRIGLDFNMALFEDGQVVLWEQGMLPQASDLLNFPPVQDIEAEDHARHYCVVLSDTGKMHCWGYQRQFGVGVAGQSIQGTNGHYPQSDANWSIPKGRLGECDPDNLPPGITDCWDGTPEGSAAVSIGEGRKVVDMCLGKDNTCMLDDTGGVKCWGTGRTGMNANRRPDLEIGDRQTIESIPYIKLNAGLEPVTIECGAKFVCVTTLAGLVRCWGENRFNQLGLGITEDLPDFVQGRGFLGGMRVGDDEDPADVTGLIQFDKCGNCLNGGVCVNDFFLPLWCDCTGTGYEGLHCITKPGEVLADVQALLTVPAEETLAAAPAPGESPAPAPVPVLDEASPPPSSSTPSSEQMNLVAEEDLCSPNPCQNGSCVASGASFTCQCLPGYTGVTCNTDIDDCTPNPCKNGAACIDGVNSFTCTCTSGLRGALCDTMEINQGGAAAGMMDQTAISGASSSGGKLHVTAVGALLGAIALAL